MSRQPLPGLSPAVFLPPHRAAAAANGAHGFRRGTASPPGLRSNRPQACPGPPARTQESSCRRWCCPPPATPSGRTGAVRGPSDLAGSCLNNRPAHIVPAHPPALPRLVLPPTRETSVSAPTLSGRSLIALLISLHSITHIAGHGDGDRELAATLYERIEESLTGLTSSGMPVTITLDDRALPAPDTPAAESGTEADDEPKNTSTPPASAEQDPGPDEEAGPTAA